MPEPPVVSQLPDEVEFRIVFWIITVVLVGGIAVVGFLLLRTLHMRKRFTSLTSSASGSSGSGASASSGSARPSSPPSSQSNSSKESAAFAKLARDSRKLSGIF